MSDIEVFICLILLLMAVPDGCCSLDCFLPFPRC
jgi:hypothetical protein